MFKYLSIFILMMSLVGLQVAWGQSSASASMDISAQVVKGADVKANQQTSVPLQQSGETAIGSIELRGNTEGLAIATFSNEIKLEDGQGRAIYFFVDSSKLSDVDESREIYLRNSSEERLQNGFYKGDLTTTIAYN